MYAICVKYMKYEFSDRITKNILEETLLHITKKIAFFCWCLKNAGKDPINARKSLSRGRHCRLKNASKYLLQRFSKNLGIDLEVKITSLATFFSKTPKKSHMPAFF